MKYIVALLVLVVVSTSFLSDENSTMFKFMKFVKEHNKEYETFEEFHERFEIFKNNLNKVENHEVFSPFMDMTEYEFSSRLTLDADAIAAAKSKMESYVLKNRLSSSELPESFNWNDQGAVMPVKNQGSCGSCWAFSAVGNLEGLLFKKTKTLKGLSEQQLVDCDKKDQGCNGGFMDDAFDYVNKAGGIMSEDDYSYKGRGGKCNFDKSKVALTISGFLDVSKNEDEIAQVLLENGPLSVAVNATPFQFYFGGVFAPKKCNPEGLNHGVLLVGFGEEKKGGEVQKYWIIKNSWGTKWGEKGYIRLQRGTGMCGVNTNVSTATIN